MIEGVTIHNDGTVTTDRKITCHCGRRADFIAVWGKDPEEIEYAPFCWHHTDGDDRADELLPIVRMTMTQESRLSELLPDVVECYTEVLEGPSAIAGLRSARYR
jgi:hypothetical protein